MDDSARSYQAKAHYEDALSMDPNQSMTHLNLGLLYEIDGEYEVSLKCLVLLTDA